MSTIAGDVAGRAAQPSSEASEPMHQLDFDRMLMECEQSIMQIVRTSISLIGIGFTITEFFNAGVGESGSRSGHPDARVLGASLLMLGLLLLALGMWSQAKYRRRLVGEMQQAAGRRNVLRYRDTPGFTVAALLLLVGLVTLVRVLMRAFF